MIVIATNIMHIGGMKKQSPPLINLDTFWPYQVVVLADIISRNTRDILKSHTQLNLSQWRVLAAIAEKPGRTAVEVVAITPMDKGIVSRAVAALITFGLAEKMPDPQDRRRATLRLTAKGQDDYVRIAKALTAAMDAIAPQTDGADKFSEILRDYTDRMPDRL